MSGFAYAGKSSDPDEIVGVAAGPSDLKSVRETLYDYYVANIRPAELSLTPETKDDFYAGYANQKPRDTGLLDGSMFRAAYDKARFVEVQAGATNSLYEVMQQRIDRIRAVTGEALENPYGSGYVTEANQRFYARVQQGAATREAYENYLEDGRGDTGLGLMRSERRKHQIGIFEEKINTLLQRNPEKADAIQHALGDGKSAREAAVNLARGANAAAAEAFDPRETSATGRFIAEFVGGFGAAITSSPIDLYSLFLGPAGAAGKGLGAVAKAAGVNAGFAAPVTLLTRADREAWAKELGLPLPDVTSEVVGNMVGAALVGGGIQGAVEVLRPVARALAGKASQQEKQAAEALLQKLSPEDQSLLHLAQREETVRQSLREAIPEDIKSGLPEAEKQYQLQAAQQHILDPDAPPPPLALPAPEGATETMARDMLSGANDPIAAVRLLRQTEAGAASALASTDPFIRQAGVTARLSEEAWAKVESGEAAFDHARLVAEYAENRADDVGLLDHLAKMQPEFEPQARKLITDEISRLERVKVAAQIKSFADKPIQLLDDAAPFRAIAPFEQEGASGGSYRFSVNRLRVDAEKMQFKSMGDAEGVTPILKGVTDWAPEAAGSIMVWQAKNGALYVADGHQRTGLARRLIASGKYEDLQINGTLYREVDGHSARDVRIMAAAKNIMEGSGTLLDGAKVLKEKPELIQKIGQINRDTTRQMTHLARLSDEAFTMVENGIVPEKYAAFVGQFMDDPARQKMALNVLAKAEPNSSAEAQIIVRRLREAELQKQQQGAQSTLFDFNDVESTFFEENKILAKALTELKKDKVLFSRAVDQADKLENAGSSIARQSSQQFADDAAKLAFILEKNADKQGVIRDTLLKAAREVKDGAQSIAQATRDFTNAIREADWSAALNNRDDARLPADGALAGGENPRGNGIQTGGAQRTLKSPEQYDAGRGREVSQDVGGNTAGGSASTVGSQAPARTAEPTAAGQQFLIDGVAPVSNQQRLNVAAEKPLRGGEAPPPKGGLFDDGARAQKDLLDMTLDEQGAVRVDAERLAQAGEEPSFFADLISACKP